ncbi:uncharacterized protein [Rhodnius prolixus]|uniref:uncharacterized protein n=1 Tax=Rhodnius prolixus TaxID=13249 RepID=UPI003D18E789
MKYLVILLSTFFLAQGLEDVDLPFKKAFEEDYHEVLAPLFKGYLELKHVIEEATKYQASYERTTKHLADRLINVPPHCVPTEEYSVEETGDDEACKALTQSLKKASELAKKVADFVHKAGLKFCRKLARLFTCVNINPVKTVKCVVDTVNDLKNLVQEFKPEALKLKDEVVELTKELKTDFKKCFGAQSKVQAETERAVAQAELCNNLY